MKAVMTVREQIIEIFKKLYDEHIESILSYDELVKEIMPGSIPKGLVIAEFKQNTRSLNKIKEGYNSKEFLNAWRYRDGILTPIMLKKEDVLFRANSNRDYFEETYARFAYSEEKGVLYLNIYYAPLSAKGMAYTLEKKDEGLILGNPMELWRA